MGLAGLAGRGGLVSVVTVLLLLHWSQCQNMVLTKGQHFKQRIKKMADIKARESRSTGLRDRQTERQSAKPLHSGHDSGRKLQQQRSNVFESCPAARYIYPGTTMDSIFDQLSVLEFQSAAQAVADKFSLIQPYGYYDLNAALTPVAAPKASTGLTGGRSVGTNLTGAGTTQAAPPPDDSPYNTEQSPGLFDITNPVLNQNITVYDDYLYNAYLYPIDKKEALAYLDNSGPLPHRYARVVVVRGSVPDVMEYKVGPLPMGPKSDILQLFADNTIPYTKRPSNDLPEALYLGQWAAYVQAALKQLSFDWLGQCGDLTDPDCEGTDITAMNINVPTRELTRNERVNAIVHFLDPGIGSAGELHNLPLAYKINNTAQDPDLWELFEFEFCGQGFDTLDDLVAAYNSSTLTICRPVNWTDKDYSFGWAETDLQQPARSDVLLPAPRLYEPAGKRFKLLQGDSPTSRVFQWGDWQGHVSTQPWTGLTFHDIRFKGDRIAYELSLNDQIVAYSGHSTVGQTFYLDAFDQLGASQYSLQPGYDCPETAAYMPVSAMGPYGTVFQANESVCLFESSGDATTWRHFDGAGVASVRQNAFVVRAVMTLGNYDYIVSVAFQLDGSIKCQMSTVDLSQVHMAGYLQSLYYDTVYKFSEKDLKYGTRVWTNTIGNLHDHLSSWKVDLDIKGVNNSFETLAVKTGTYEEVLGKGQTPPWALPTDIMKYQDEKRIETETGFVLDYKVPTVFRFVNENSTNHVGVTRGYGIFHGYTTTQLLPSSHPITKAAAWSKYHIAIAQRKEDEPTSGNDMYDSHAPGDPLYSLNYILNNESVVNQDLVAWVSMGIVHVPRSEDVPLITNVGTEFEIRPVNYFDRLASMDVQNSDDFAACAADQGVQSSFDYSYGGENTQGNKGGFKYTGPISSRDLFQASSPRSGPASVPLRQPGAASPGRPAAGPGLNGVATG